MRVVVVAAAASHIFFCYRHRPFFFPSPSSSTVYLIWFAYVFEQVDVVRIFYTCWHPLFVVRPKQEERKVKWKNRTKKTSNLYGIQSAIRTWIKIRTRKKQRERAMFNIVLHYQLLNMGLEVEVEMEKEGIFLRSSSHFVGVFLYSNWMRSAPNEGK